MSSQLISYNFEPMKTFTHSLFNIAIPDHWVAEDEPDYTTLYDPDGVGALIISGFEHEEDVNDDDLEDFAADHIDSEVESEDVEYGSFSGFSLCYEIDDEYLCEWYLRSGKIMLFITYSCPLEEEGNSEEDIVETMLDSLQT